MNTLTSRCVLLKPLVSLKWIPHHCHVGEFLTGLFNTRQVQLRPPTLTLFVQFHGAIYTLLWVVSKPKKSAWIPKKKHTPQKQVILDDVGGDIISKIPTSPSFFILFEHIKYDWNKPAPLHPFKTNNLRQLFTDHYTTFHEVLVFCFGTRPRFPRKKHTLDNPKLGANQETLPSSKLCYPWRRKLLRVSHGNRRKENGRIPVRRKKPPFQSSRLFLALAPWEWEQPEQYESDWKSFPEGSW